MGVGVRTHYGFDEPYGRRYLMSWGKLAVSVAGYLAAALIAFACHSALAQASGPFTKDQMDAGREGFKTNCAQCHGADLSGATAPALVGDTFRSAWSGHTTAELYKFIQSSMPVCQGGSLADRTYAEILAFVLSANGARPGSQDLDAETDVRIGDLISGVGAPNSGKPR